MSRAGNNYYHTLQVHYQAPQAEIKLAYRKLVKKFHPDCNHDLNNHDQISAINIAYEILSNPQTRASYDQSMGLSTKVSKNSNTSNVSTVVKKRSQGLDEDGKLDLWLTQVYEPIIEILNQILDNLDDQIDQLADDPFDQDLLDNFQEYIQNCRNAFNYAQILFRKMPNPASAAGVAAYLYHCLNQVGDGIEELNYFTLNFDDHHLHTGQELWRIADEMRSYAFDAVRNLSR
ncbi:DnaJ-class molecular chaperone with C-terminal Zn finger domain [Synechococcus sp. PCC 7502]|uniref:J domain-containing protein n=1 Tax=Synechococcus sp. PCC 7502 TaxID=1173263 RepID=UPI00029F9B74|nr:DnaJ domain-containing protein [Synechococcus sp. PCC 7502]AFY72638.1 DnaJ-class molecular chaperone with C-terminal Zn finger domain [Synechococcus sp. PCC 7502]